MACAAMAIASSANARKVQIVNASWWVATVTDWSLPASLALSTTAYVVSSSAARRVRVRISRATPDRAAARMPGRSGRRAARSRRAPRTTTTRRALAAAVWASTEPQAEPARPSPANLPTP